MVFVTGHAKPGDAGTDWRALADTARQAKLTLVIYMGVSGAQRIQDELLHHAIVIQIEGASYRLRAHSDLVPEHTRAISAITPPPPPKRRGRPPKERTHDHWNG